MGQNHKYVFWNFWIIFCFIKFQRCLEKAKKKVSDDIRELEEIAEELKTVMGGLKTQLYAKFGNHINLEEED